MLATTGQSKRVRSPATAGLPFHIRSYHAVTLPQHKTRSMINTKWFYFLVFVLSAIKGLIALVNWFPMKPVFPLESKKRTQCLNPDLKVWTKRIANCDHKRKFGTFGHFSRTYRLGCFNANGNLRKDNLLAVTESYYSIIIKIKMKHHAIGPEYVCQLQQLALKSLTSDERC